MPLGVGAGLAIAGSLGAAGSAFNGAMTKRGAKQYNKGQMEIAKMNNQWNAEQASINRTWEESMMDKQNQWNLEQWNRENEYNSPVAQAERLKAAGINPAFMAADGGTAGSVSSASPGSVASPTASTPNQVPAVFNMDFNNVTSAISAYFDAKESASRTVGQDLNNQLQFKYGDALTRSMIASAIDGKFEYLTDDYKRIRQDFGSSLGTMSIDKTRMELQSMVDSHNASVAQTGLVILKSEAQGVLNKYLTANQQADLMIKAATLQGLHIKNRFGNVQIEHEIAKMLETQARTNGLVISNHVAQQTAASVIAATNAANDYNTESFTEQMRNFVPKFEAENRRLKALLENIDNETKLSIYGYDGFGNRGKGLLGYRGTVAKIIKNSLGLLSDSVLGPLFRGR